LDLNALRQTIDTLDEKLVDLINERAKVVEQVGQIKRSDKNAPPIYAPDRERAVFDKIKANNHGPLPDRCLMAIYRELMSGSFYLERPLRIAFLGPKGSFSHSAALLKFGQCVDYEPLSSIADVFKEIENKHCDMGIVPIENSISGGIIETLDALIDSTVIICAEATIAIHHNLLANCQLEEIKVIYSKPEIFVQCRNWLNATLPNIATISAASSADAAKIAAKEQNAAAIGSSVAAELYEIATLFENIEDRSNNITRFFVIGREPSRPSGKDKTALMFSTAHKTGALVDVLQSFRNKGINLTNIESRPSKKRQMEYYFFVNCEGHQNDDHLKEAINEAKKHCLQLTTLGSFPAGPEIL